MNLSNGFAQAKFGDVVDRPPLLALPKKNKVLSLTRHHQQTAHRVSFQALLPHIFLVHQALVEKARENLEAPPLQAGRVSKETVFKRADARDGGDASAGARLAAHKQKQQQQQQQQQQQHSGAVGSMDGARIKANQIANLRLMAVLNYRFAVSLWLDSIFFP